MRKLYESYCDLADKAESILELQKIIDGVITQDCPNQKRTLTALNDMMRLAVTDLFYLLDGGEIRGGGNA